MTDDPLMPYSADTYMARIDPQDPEPHTLALAGDVIRRGGLVAFPTETVYGLGANALDADAVARIFAAKERPANDPVIVHIHDVSQLTTIARDVPDAAFTLADAFWPGALTLVLHKHENIPANVTAGQDTVAVRLPSHPVARLLIQRANTPIAAPSANRFSRPSPTTALHVLADLKGRVDVILNAGRTPIGVESTIISLVGDMPQLLRPGGVSLEALRAHLPGLAFRPQYIADDETAPAPGTLTKHYSPRADVLVFSGDNDAAVYNAMLKRIDTLIDQQKQVGVLARDDETRHFDAIRVQIVLMGSDDDDMAANLFMGLRALDAAEVDVIVVRAPSREGIGLALYDRLIRAASGYVIDV